MKVNDRAVRFRIRQFILFVYYQDFLATQLESTCIAHTDEYLENFSFIFVKNIKYQVFYEP